MVSASLTMLTLKWIATKAHVTDTERFWQRTATDTIFILWVRSTKLPRDDPLRMTAKQLASPYTATNCRLPGSRERRKRLPTNCQSRSPQAARTREKYKEYKQDTSKSSILVDSTNWPLASVKFDEGYAHTCTLLGMLLQLLNETLGLKRNLNLMCIKIRRGSKI